MEMKVVRRKRTLICAAILAVLAAAAVGQLFSDVRGSGAQAPSGLVISIDGEPDGVAVGGTVTYTVTVTNVETTDHGGVIMDDSLRGNGVIESVTPSQGSCAPPTSKGVRCFLGTLAAGATATITIEKLASLEPAVGGVSFDVPQGPEGLPQDAADSSGHNPGLLAGLIAGAMAGGAMLVGAALYVKYRRAWAVRRR